MLVFVQMSVLPPGSSIGPTFNITSVPAGIVTPNSITLAELLAGISVNVPDGTTSLILQSTGECTDEITVPVQYCPTCEFGDIEFEVYCSLCETCPIVATVLCPPEVTSNCLIAVGEAGFGNSIDYSQHVGNIIGLLNGQYIFQFQVTPSNSVILLWSGTNWELRADFVSGTLLATLNIPYTPGDPVPLPGNQNIEFWISEISYPPTWIRLTQNGTKLLAALNTNEPCCTCLTLRYRDISFNPVPGNYSGTYVDCNGNTQTWEIQDTDPFALISFCSSDLQATTFTTGPSVVMNPSLGSTCTRTNINDDPSCPGFCVVFQGGLGNTINIRQNAIASRFGVTNNSTGISFVYTFIAPDSTVYYVVRDRDPLSLIIYFYICTDFNDAVNTAYARIPVSQVVGTLPIGYAWECINVDCATQGLGVVYTELDCTDKVEPCNCWRFTLKDETPSPTTGDITYINCNGNIVTETIELFTTTSQSNSYPDRNGLRRCVKIGEIPIVDPLFDATLMGFCEYRFDENLDEAINCYQQEDSQPVP